MKWVVAVVMLIVLLFGVAVSEGVLEPYYVLCNPESYVNVREFPSKKNEPSGRLYYGDVVMFDGKRKNGYMHIVNLSTEMGEGWVYKIYLDMWEPMDDVKGLYFNCSRGRVALRNGVNGKRIGWLKPGSEIYVLGMTSEWAVTSIGYVKTKYLEEIADEEN